MTDQDINARQNDSEHLRMLRASGVVHRWALMVDTARWALALAVGVVALAAMAFTEFQQAAVFASIGYAVVGEIVIGLIFSHLNRRAALIQQKFDTSLFALQWDSQSPPPADEELVRLAARSRRGDEGIRDWYVDVTGIPAPVAQIICQRQNARWDSTLRQDWVWRLVALATGYLVVGYTVAFFGNWTLAAHATWWIAPALPLLVSLTITVIQHRNVISSRRNSSVEVERALSFASEHPDRIDELWKSCAAVQTQLLESRSNSPRVPNWFYARRKKHYALGFDVDAEGFRARWTEDE
jgi:hypothetical protein